MDSQKLLAIVLLILGALIIIAVFVTGMGWCTLVDLDGASFLDWDCVFLLLHSSVLLLIGFLSAVIGAVLFVKHGHGAFPKE